MSEIFINPIHDPLSQEIIILKIMYSPIDGYRCTATAVAAASRRQRPKCSTAAVTAGPMLFNTHTNTHTERSQSGLVAAGPIWNGSSRAVETSVFEQGTTEEESLHNVK